MDKDTLVLCELILKGYNKDQITEILGRSVKIEARSGSIRAEFESRNIPTDAQLLQHEEAYLSAFAD